MPQIAIIALFDNGDKLNSITYFQYMVDTEEQAQELITQELKSIINEELNNKDFEIIDNAIVNKKNKEVYIKFMTLNLITTHGR